MIDRIWFTKGSSATHRELIAPYKATPEQEALFQHCAHGLGSVTPKYFDEVVGPLLKIHGVEEWAFFKEGDEIPEE